MAHEPDIDQVAAALRVSMGLLVRRLRQVPARGDLTMPEISALARLERGGPMTATALAKLEQISPQSMGVTLSALELRRLVERDPDPDDGRKAVISVSHEGLLALSNNRNARTEALAQALAAGFTRSELRQLQAVGPLLERLAEAL